MSKYGIIKGTRITEVGNMNKKLLALLAAGALVITGCASKDNEKNKEEDKKSEQTANSSEQKKEEDNNSSKEQNSTETLENNGNNENSVSSQSGNNGATQTVKTANHDFASAEKLVDVVAISGNDLSRLSSQTNLLHWVTQPRIKITKASDGESLYKVSSSDYLDVINALTSKTYTKEEAVNLLKGSHFNVKDNSSSKSNVAPKEDEVYYYKGDKAIVFSTKIMGNNFSQEVESQDKWVVEGDKIKVNVVDKMTKTKVSTITLKINDKQYEGGNKKSKYYVESIKK